MAKKKSGANVRAEPPAPEAPTPASSGADDDCDGSESRLTIVGVGASAGGMNACIELVESLGKPDAELAIVLVQHLDPSRASELADILGTRTPLQVVQAADALPIEAGHIYVIPPNAQMDVRQGALYLYPLHEAGRRYHAIDSFFKTLAEDAGRCAVGVILSGTGSDGAQGLREIKAVGGITLAQKPETAEYDGMPRAAINAGVADLVLSPREIGEELLRIASSPYVRHAEPHEKSAELEPNADDLQRLFTLVRGATGVDFSKYKEATIRRRLQRRMLLHKSGSVGEYLGLLQKKPAEIRSLHDDILIHVTRFFRDPESFEILTKRAFPEFLRARGGDEPIRIWVCGCSTGEDAYSVSIALLEFLDDKKVSFPIQIFATDVSEPAVGAAREGKYPENIADKDVSPERLQRFFTKVGGQYQINKTVRDLCIFARQDVTRDPPFSRIDLVVCRNVLIYLQQPTQRKVLGVFHYALKPSGFLLLSPAETIGAQADLFSVVDKRHKLYLKKHVAIRPEMDFASQRASSKRVELPPRGDLRYEADRAILHRYSPPGVVVDGELQIVEFRGQTGKYLEPAPGEVNMHILKMAREGLLYGLRTALHEARTDNRSVRREGLRVRYNGHRIEVSVEVIPLTFAGGEAHFLVLFEDSKATAAESAAGTAAQPAPDLGDRDGDAGNELRRVQEELVASRSYLQAVIHDLEIANEELKSANEEILSSNEELQSTNEELDTAKEELQSTNEELNTLNDELRARNEELTLANSDLLNLLGSVQIALVIVSGDLRIRRFTPMAERVLNLIPGDVGRPISHIKPNIDCPDLEQLITKTVESVSTYEHEVKDNKGHWLSMAIRPYKGLDNRIDGAVLILVDVDEPRRHEATARVARDCAQAIVRTVREPLLILDEHLHVVQFNRAFLREFGMSAEDIDQRPIHELGDGEWDFSCLRALLGAELGEEAPVKDAVLECESRTGGKRSLSVSARRVSSGGIADDLIVVALSDATGQT